MTASLHPFGKALAASQHPHDSDRFYADRGDSSMVMPNGSVVTLSHRAPFELAASMTIAVAEAWAEEATKEQP